MELTKENDVIELKSTLKGLTGMMVARISWLLALFIVLNFFIFTWADGIMAKYKVSSFWSFYHLRGRVDHDDGFLIFILSLVGCVLIAVIFFIFYDMVCEIYKALYVNRIFSKDGKIIETGYSFPFKMSTHEVRFNQLARVDVIQDSFDRLVGTGTLALTIILYANADSVIERWVIPAIAEPEIARAAILSALPASEGMLVKVAASE